MVGEALGALSLRDLKNLEGKVERGISRIRSKKVYTQYFDVSQFLLIEHDLLISISVSQNDLLYAEIEFLRKRVSKFIKKNVIFLFNIMQFTV